MTSITAQRILALARAKPGDADAVIVVGERRPRAFDWIGDRPGVRAAGDCIVPRRVQHAVSEGCQAAAEILESTTLKSGQVVP